MNLSTTGLRLTANSVIDLHMHTTYSDGHWAPETLLDHLLSEQFALVAITDHDRVDSVPAIQQLARDRHLPVLVGVEMTTSWIGEMTDLLCFGFNCMHNALANLSRDLLHRQQENSREVYDNLQRQGYLLPPEVLPELLAQPGSKQPHALVAILKKHGYGLGVPSAGEIAWEAGIRFAMNQPAAVVDAAHQSGGVCLLAHPGHGDGFVTYSAELLDQFRQEAPIDGIEVYHPVHTPSQVAMYRDYAERHNLLVSAGSDSHGPEKPPVRYRADLCRDLLERVGVKIQ